MRLIKTDAQRWKLRSSSAPLCLALALGLLKPSVAYASQVDSAPPDETPQPVVPDPPPSADQSLRQAGDGQVEEELTAGITITARRRGTTVEIDRTVYDVEVGPDGATLNSVDVLRRLPGVIVSPSNNITIRGGASVGFLVDGKPVRRNIALAIPASQIERVELLTNPSAEYDSDGGALVNLILKKDANAGWNGTVSGKADTLGGYRAGVDVAHGGSVWTLNGSASVRSDPTRIRRNRQVDYLVAQDGGVTRQLSNVIERSSFDQLAAQARLNGRLSDRNNLNFTLGVNVNSNPHEDRFRERFLPVGSNPALIYRRDIRFNGLYPTGSASFESKVKDDYRMTVSLDLYVGDSNEERRFSGDLRRFFQDEVYFDFLEGKVEFEKNLRGGSLFTAGVVASTNSVDDKLTLVGFRGADLSDRNEFNFGRQSYAAYLTFQAVLAGVEVKPGLRLERFDQKLRSAGQRIDGFGGTTRVLPTLHLSRKLGDVNAVNASFTTRFEKPDALLFNPFRRFNSPFQADQGNPFLRPSTRTQAEASHVYNRKSLFFTQTVFFRSTKDDINSFVFLGDDSLTIASSVNLGSSRAYGYSLAVKQTVIPELVIGYGVDLFRKSISAPSGLSEYGSISYSGFSANLNAEYAVDKNNTFSVNGAYESRSFSIGLSNPPIISSDFQYTHLFSNKLSLSVNLIDFVVPQRLTSRFGSPNLSGFESVRNSTRLVRIGLAMPF